MRPDKKDTTYSVLVRSENKIPPDIIFGVKALKWIGAIVDVHNSEVGFYSAVDHREDGSYFIRDVYYPKHSEMNGGTCEISADGETDLVNRLIDSGREDDIEKIKFWGHSHHTMPTSASSQDEQTALEKLKANQSFFIRAICNKEGEISVSFFDYVKRIRFDHVKWRVVDDSDDEAANMAISLVSQILSSESPLKDKLEKIRRIVNSDPEMEKIRKKVEELKKINEPKNKHENHYNNDKQGDMFGKSEKKQWGTSSKKYRSLQTKKQRTIDYIDKELLSQDDINQIMCSWEQRNFQY